MAEDYYKVLGVDRKASEDDIQKAYRRLARKHHPDMADDKEASKQKFQAVQQAYDVLSDSKKRSLYDQFGPDFEQVAAGHQAGGGRQMDIDLKDLFGGGGPFAGGQGSSGAFDDILRQFGGGFSQGGFAEGFGQTPNRQGGRHPGGVPNEPVPGSSDIQQEVTVSFNTAVLGGQHQMALKRGDGKVEEFKFKVPAGIEDGKKIRLRGQGRTDPRTGKPGDLLVKIRIAAHPVYQRKGSNLVVQLPISFSEAALGAKVDLATPHGTIAVTIPPASSSHKTLRLKGMGIQPAQGDSGDLLVELQIVAPQNLDSTQQDVLQSLDGGDQDSIRSAIYW